MGGNSVSGTVIGDRSRFDGMVYTDGKMLPPGSVGSFFAKS